MLTGTENNCVLEVESVVVAGDPVPEIKQRLREALEMLEWVAADRSGDDPAEREIHEIWRPMAIREFLDSANGVRAYLGDEVAVPPGWRCAMPGERGAGL